MKPLPPVLIVGGGWAGMAAALELERHNIPITLLESGRRPGGRARSVVIQDKVLDNGQHLLIGAYRETLRLLTLMGLREEEVLLRQRLALRVLDRQCPLDLAAPRLPAPFHLLWGLLSAKGIRFGDKLRALQMSLKLALSGYAIATDTTVEALLASHKQGPELIKRFWEPLCLATLNTPTHKASAAVFLRVLKDSFTQRREDSDLLIPRVPLGELFCETAVKKLLQNHRNHIELGSRVVGIEETTRTITTVTAAGKRFSAPDVILATSAQGASQLLAPLPTTKALAETLGKLGSQPIATIYLHYPEAPPLPLPLLGLSGTTAQWIFDRRVCAQPGWYAVVVSAEGEHTNWGKEQLAARIQQELASHLPGWPNAAERYLVIREKRATFECRKGIEALRPDNATALDGLWLAGDYTATGYPATLEGAVRSGVQCARRIIERRQNIQ
jgi:squalene-associated FAD-dependent desaturase